MIGDLLFRIFKKSFILYPLVIPFVLTAKLRAVATAVGRRGCSRGLVVNVNPLEGSHPRLDGVIQIFSPSLTEVTAAAAARRPAASFSLILRLSGTRFVGLKIDVAGQYQILVQFINF